jgi:hypothetical protein
MMPQSFALSALLIVLVATTACDQPDRNRARTRTSPPSVTGLESAEPLAIGAVLRSSITGDEPLICVHVDEGTRSEGPCQRFRLRTPEAGVLVIHVTWDDHRPLRLKLRTREGAAQSTSCCNSPMDLRANLEAGDVYEIDVILLTEWGSPERQSFELTASVQQRVS